MTLTSQRLESINRWNSRAEQASRMNEVKKAYKIYGNYDLRKEAEKFQKSLK